MTHTDKIKIGLVTLAVLLQIVAMIRANPLRKTVRVQLWFYLIMLNLFVLSRRFLTLTEIGMDWHGEYYETIASFIGIFVSIFMLLTVNSMRKHLELDKQVSSRLADATVELAHTTKTEDSGAYKLALAFIKERERREAEKLSDIKLTL